MPGSSQGDAGTGGSRTKLGTGNEKVHENIPGRLQAGREDGRIDGIFC